MSRKRKLDELLELPSNDDHIPLQVACKEDLLMEFCRRQRLFSARYGTSGIVALHVFPAKKAPSSLGHPLSCKYRLIPLTDTLDLFALTTSAITNTWFGQPSELRCVTNIVNMDDTIVIDRGAWVRNARTMQSILLTQERREQLGSYVGNSTCDIIAEYVVPIDIFVYMRDPSDLCTPARGRVKA